MQYPRVDNNKGKKTRETAKSLSMERKNAKEQKIK